MRVNQYLNIILKMLFFSISKIIIALVKKKTKTTSKGYENFLEKNGLKFKKLKINNQLFNKKAIKNVYEVNEGVYLYEKFKKKIFTKNKKKQNKIIFKPRISENKKQF